MPWKPFSQFGGGLEGVRGPTPGAVMLCAPSSTAERHRCSLQVAGPGICCQTWKKTVPYQQAETQTQGSACSHVPWPLQHEQSHPLVPRTMHAACMTVGQDVTAACSSSSQPWRCLCELSISNKACIPQIQLFQPLILELGALKTQLS